LYYLLLAMQAVPGLLACINWWTYFRNRGQVVSSKRIIFTFGLVAITISSLSLIAIVFSSLPFFDDAQSRPASHESFFMGMIGAGLLGAALTFFGTKPSRTLSIASGVLSAILWYLLVALGI
jgi:hypothetical protein